MTVIKFSNPKFLQQERTRDIGGFEPELERTGARTRKQGQRRYLLLTNCSLQHKISKKLGVKKDAGLFSLFFVVAFRER